MSSQFYVSLVIVGYLLVVSGLFVVEMIKRKRNKGHEGHH